MARKKKDKPTKDELEAQKNSDFVNNATKSKNKRGALGAVLGFLIYGLTTTIVIGGFAFYWVTSQFAAPNQLTETKTLSVERGSGLNAIARQLEDMNAIENATIFIAGARLQGAQSDLQAGEYEVTPQMSAKEVLAMLRDGKTVQRRFTIPEGRTSFEIVRELGGIDALSGTVPGIPKEGSLLPDTYDYQLNESRMAVLARLQQSMIKTLIELCNIDMAGEKIAFSKIQNKPCGDGQNIKTVRDLITLASIVEKETGIADERPRVAGVFINRLQRGIALQTDPTVIYAITKGRHENEGKGPLGRRILRKDLKFDSPYNTYQNAGLPPGPIANPGRASLEAVLNPESHDYIFFVADGTGGHAFGKTLAEHNANVAKWRKVRDAQ